MQVILFSLSPTQMLTLTFQPAEDDLAAPIALRDAAQVLKEIMVVYDSSLLHDEHEGSNTPSREMQNFDTTLTAMVDPMLEMCRRMAALRDKGDWETAIFMINCLTYLQVCYSTF